MTEQTKCNTKSVNLKSLIDEKNTPILKEAAGFRGRLC